MSGGTHAVKSGDTLGAIAAANGTTVAELCRLNPQCKDANFIHARVGLRLAAKADLTRQTPKECERKLFSRNV